MITWMNTLWGAVTWNGEALLELYNGDVLMLCITPITLILVILLWPKKEERR